jgi:hypothetical protein
VLFDLAARNNKRQKDGRGKKICITYEYK